MHGPINRESSRSADSTRARDQHNNSTYGVPGIVGDGGTGRPWSAALTLLYTQPLQVELRYNATPKVITAWKPLALWHSSYYNSVLLSLLLMHAADNVCQFDQWIHSLMSDHSVSRNTSTPRLRLKSNTVDKKLLCKPNTYSCVKSSCLDMCRQYHDM